MTTVAPATTRRGRRGSRRAISDSTAGPRSGFTMPRRSNTASSAGSSVYAEIQHSTMPDPPMAPKSRKPRKSVTISDAYAMPAASAAVSVPVNEPPSARASACCQGSARRRSSRWRASTSMPKLMPLPTTIDDRNALTLLRWPMVRRARPNVTTAPAASDMNSAISPAAVR